MTRRYSCRECCMQSDVAEVRDGVGRVPHSRAVDRDMILGYFAVLLW